VTRESPHYLVMAMGVAAAVWLIAVPGCQPTPPQDDFDAAPRCVDIDRPAASAFVIACATAANPKSDEEGEDLVRQCELTATNLHCLRTEWKVWPHYQEPKAVLCRKVVGDAQRACVAKGWDGR
jgi:hypothetical protein